MIKLVYNEWIKYFMRLGTLIMSAILVMMMLLELILNQMFGYSDNLLEKSYTSDHWKTEVKQDIVKMQQNIAPKKASKSNKNDSDELKDMQKQTAYQERIEMLKNYLEKDIQPPANTHFFGALSGVGSYTGLSLIMVVVITSALMSREFQQGTIKLLLIRPQSRIMIYFSKWIAALLIAFMFTLMTYVFKGIIALCTTSMDPTQHFVYKMIEKGKLVDTSFWPFLFKLFINDFILMAIFATIAYVLSVVLRNTAISLGITLGLQFFSQLLVMFFSAKTNFVQYIWPANWNLNQYFELATSKPDKDMTYAFSSIYNLIALIIIVLIGLILFNKRDVAN